VAEGKGGNVASVGLSLDSSAFNSGVARALADISRLLTGLRELQAASQKTNLGQLGVGGRAGGASGAFTPAGFARDIQRLAIPALRQLDRTAAASPLLGGRMARNAGFDPVAMATAINRQTIPAMQRLSRTMSGLRDSSDFMKEFEAGRAARERAHRTMLERESRITQEIARGTTKRLERERSRMVQAAQSENIRATDPNTQGSRQLRAAIEMRRQLAEQKRYVEANPTPTQTRYAGGGRGGGSREGRWGDVSDLKGIPKDWRNVLMQLEQQGWRIEGRPSGHPVAKPVNREFKPITFPGTPSDARALQNFISLARKAGGVINGRGYRDEAGFGPRKPGMYEDPRTGAFTLGAKYGMTSLERMIASTESERGYPTVMQPRPRGSQAQLSQKTREEIHNMSTKFQREKIFTPTTNLEEGLIATVVNQAGQEFVLSGNGRTLGMRQIVKNLGETGKEVIRGSVAEFMKKNPGEFGKGETAALAKEAKAIIAAGETPMLVRRLTSSMEQLGPRQQGQLGLQLNARTGLTTEEIAHAASRMIGPLPQSLLAGDPRKSIAAGKGEAFSAFRGQLVEEALGSTLASKRFGTGTEMTNLMMQTLVAKAYGNNTATAEMLTSAYSKEPSALGSTTRAALERNLGPQLRLRGRIESGELPAAMDPIFNNLPGALKLMQEATTGPQAWISGAQREGLVGNQLGAARALLSQKTMFGGKIPREHVRLASAMLSVPSGGLGAFLSTMTSYGAKAEGAQASLFGEEGGSMKADPRQAVRMAIEASNRYVQGSKGMRGKGSSAQKAALFETVLNEVFSGMPQAVPTAAAIAAKPAVKAASEAVATTASEAIVETVAKANPGFRRPNAYRATPEGGYGISPRELGIAQGSVKARAGGYIPYAESDPKRQGVFNTRLATGYMKLMENLQNYVAQPRSAVPEVAMGQLQMANNLRALAKERGVSLDPLNGHEELAASVTAMFGTALKTQQKEAVATTKAAEAGTKTSKAKEKVAKEEEKVVKEAEKVLTGGAGGGGRGRPTALSGAGGGDPTNPLYAAAGGRATLARLRSNYNMSLAGLNAKTGKYLVDPNESVLNTQKANELRQQMRALMSGTEFKGLSSREQARQISILSEKFGPLRSLQGEKLASTQVNAQTEGGPEGMQRFSTLLRPFLETYLPARRMTSLNLAESGMGGLQGMYNTAENSMLLTGLRQRSSGSVLRTMIHELSHGQFQERMRQGYRNPAEVPQINNQGQIVRNAQGNIQYMPHALAAARYGEPMSAGHLDPEFYRLQAATSKSSGALPAQLAFHRLMGEAVPGGFGNQKAMSEFGVGKEAARLLPELQKLASPAQTKLVNNYLETIKNIYNKLGSTTGKGLGSLQRYAQRSFGSAIGLGLLPESGGLQAASHIGNYLSGLTPESFKGKNLQATRMGLLSAAAQGTTALIGPESQLSRPMQEISGARSEVAKYLVGLSPLEKGMLALGMNPESFVKAPGAKPFFDPKNVEHVEKANQMVRQLVRSFQEVSKAEIPAAERLVTGGRASRGAGRGTRELPMLLENVPHTGIPGGVVLQGARPGAPGQPGSFTGGGALVPYNPETAAESIRRYYGQALVSGGGLSGRFFRGVGMERLMMPQAQIQESLANARGLAGSALYNSPLGAPLSAFRQAREAYSTRGLQSAELKSGAKVAYQKQVMETEAMANAQTRLNRVMGSGNINFNQLGKVMTEVGTGFTAGAMSSLRFAANLAIGQQAVFAFVGMINHLRGGIIEFNAKIEAASVGFTTLFHNAGYSLEDAKKKTDDFIVVLRDFANVTNFRFGDLETAALRMKAFGFEIDSVKAKAKGQMAILEEIPNPWRKLTGEAKQFRGALVNIGDAVAALGAEDDKLRRVTYALGQMNSAGRVYQNDMMQLANAGIAGYEILSQAVIKQIEADPALKKANMEIYKKLLDPKTAVETIRKLARVGRLSGPESVQAILQGLGERYGGGMMAYSRTFSGAMTTLADTSQSLIATSFKPLFDVVRDFTVQLADLFQTEKWINKSKAFGDIISKIAMALRQFIPGFASAIMKLGSSFVSTFGKLGSALGSTKSTLGGLVQNFSAGIGTIGKLLENDVIRNLGVAAIAAKLLMSTLASNPLLATIGLVTTAIGAISTAVKNNSFGFGDLFDRVKPQFDKILARISDNFVPGVTEGLSAGIETFLATMGALVRSLSPILITLLDVFSKIGAAVKPFASIIGMALAAFIGKKVLVDGMAAAMGKFGNATMAAAQALERMQNSRAMGGFMGAGGAFGASKRMYAGNKLYGLSVNEPQGLAAMMGASPTMALGQTGVAGMGYGSPALMRAAMHILPKFAAANGMELTGIPAGALVPGATQNAFVRNNALNPETANLVMGRYRELYNNRNTAEGKVEWAALKKDMGTSGMRALSNAYKEANQSSIAQLGQFVMKLKTTGLSLESLKTVIKAIAARAQMVGTAMMGIGMFTSLMGSALNSKTLTAIGDGLTQVGFGISGLAMAGNALKVAFGTMGLAIAGVLIAISALVGWWMDQQVTDEQRKAAADYQGAYSSQQTLLDYYGKTEYQKLFPNIPTNLPAPPEKPTAGKVQVGSTLYKTLIENGYSPEQALAYQPNEGEIKDQLDEWVKKLAAWQKEYLDKVSPEDLLRQNAQALILQSPDKLAGKMFLEGASFEQIAKATGKTVDQVKAMFKDLAGGSKEAQDAIAKVLSDNLDATGAALKEAQDAYQKALEPFQTDLARLTSRTQEIIQEMFDAEKKALEDEKAHALENTMVMYNGEMVRLGVLEEQYGAMKQQREEMDKMAELEKQRTAAAEAALDVFDASVAPLERARKAREAARDLFNQMGTNKLDQMSKAIEAGKGSVSYTETTTYYEDKAKALQKDQAERARSIQEQMDDLMKQIQEGRIGTAAAKQKFKDIFASAGLDLDVAQSQGYSFMSSFGDGFMKAMQNSVTKVFKALPGLIAKAAEAARQDKLYKAAQDALDIFNTGGQTKVTGKTYKEKYLADQKKSVQRVLAALGKKYANGKVDPGYFTTGGGKNIAQDKQDEIRALLVKTITGLNNQMANISDTAEIFASEVKSQDSAFRTALQGILLPNNQSLIEALTNALYGGGTGGPTSLGQANAQLFLPSYILPGGAAGGMISSAGQFMVGERGPEMIEVGQNGIRVVPNHKLPSWLRSSAGALGAVNMGLGGYAFGTGSGDSGMHNLNNMQDWQKTVARFGRNGQMGGDWKSALGMLLMRAGAPLGALAGKAGGLLERYVENGMKEGSWSYKLGQSWENLGQPGYEPGKFVQMASKLTFLQNWGLKALDNNGFSNYLSKDFLKTMGITGATIGGTMAEMSAPGFLMDLLTGGPRSMTPPNVHAHPSRSPISGTVNIHNPQLNSAADIDRLAERVAAAQARALRSTGYVKR